MILAAGLTPAYQEMLLLRGLRLGEVNRAREALWCASGKVLNVGLALHHLGGWHRTLALLGGLTGKAIEEEFRDLGVSARWVWSARRTRVCTTILDEEAGVTTELVEESPAASPDELEAFLEAYTSEASRASLVVLSGSLPGGTPRTFYRDLLERTPCRSVLDARGPELLEALGRRPFLVKPNREELGATVGRKLEGRDAVLEAMAEVRRLGTEWVVVTAGKEALLAMGPPGAFALHPLETRVVNPIGCGDSLAAGTAWGIAAGLPVPKSLALGVAAAAQNAAALLPARLDPARVEEMARGVVIEAL